MNFMAIGAKSAATDTAAALPTAGNSAATKENFLQLLVAQIKHQNPLNPQDGTQFLSQLSQFTEMEQMLGMREDLKAIRAELTAAKTADPTN
jgi:flagellar basal-body rod modification protein FlgD